MSDRFSAPSDNRYIQVESLYNKVRPAPPEALADLLVPMVGGTKPRLVVDLGSGTGLSTRYWSEHAQNTIGIEPGDSMRREAEQIGGDRLSYMSGYSHETGLPDECAQIVVCGHSLHWMEPNFTFTEVNRILQPGGLLAAYDYDWPPSTGCWQVDQAFEQCMTLVHRLVWEQRIAENLQQWHKEGHIHRMQESGLFRYTRECVLHHSDSGDARRLVGLFLSQNYVRALLHMGFPESELQIDRLRQTAESCFKGQTTTWFWSARVRIGIK